MLEDVRNEPRTRTPPQSDSQKRSTDGTTAKEQVVRIRDRTTAANEPVARREEVKQHGYEDSEKNNEDLEQ